MQTIIKFENEYCNTEFYSDRTGEFGWAKITYDKEKYIKDTGNTIVKGNIISKLDDNNQVNIDLDTYRSFGDGSFECWCNGEEVEGDEDYILNIE